MSDRLRLDLALNDFVASAVINNRIEILSNGSPWRPLIHVIDMSRAIEWAILRDKNISTPYLAVNIGSSSWNYQVSELAKAVANNVSNCKVSVNTQDLPDKRSYKVNFDLFGSLAPNHNPIYTLQDTISELIDGISDIRHLISDDFRASEFIRLYILEKYLKNRKLSRDLRWT
jgi:nucleoside-diphosphate-sugar epimerase